MYSSMTRYPSSTERDTTSLRDARLSGGAPPGGVASAGRALSLGGVKSFDQLRMGCVRSGFGRVMRSLGLTFPSPLSRVIKTNNVLDPRPLADRVRRQAARHEGGLD